MTELTNDQIERQDHVDNTIVQCLNALSFHEFDHDYAYWNKNGFVGKLRTLIGAEIASREILMTEDEFYPSVDAWDEDCSEHDTWCTCQVNKGSYYVPDDVCNCGIIKHHYHCNVCRKITQIG